VTYDLRSTWNDDIQALKDTGRSVLDELASGKAVNADQLKRKLEAIRVHNTTIRTDIAIVKLSMAQKKMVVRPKLPKRVIR
jgi:hypothetical protein